MGPLRPFLAALMLLLARPASAEPMLQWSGYIAEASARFGIPEQWIRRVIRAESGGRTRLGGRPIVSSAGAMGLMQLMPGTWREIRAAHGLGRNPHDPRDNILAGTAYLRAMYDRFGYPGLFAAYHAGPARYADYVSNGRPLPSETVAYAASLSKALPIASRAAAPRSAAGSIFVALAGTARPSATAPGSDSLFLLGPTYFPTREGE